MNIIEILKAILFGIVEGITEWLPVSSTGHLIILDRFITLKQSEEFKSVFDVVIQLGAILAVVIIFWKQIWPFGQKPEDPLTPNGIGKYIKKDIFVMWLKIVVACIPAIVIGLPFDDWFEEHFYNEIVVSLALIIVGAAFIFIENKNKTKESKINSVKDISFKTAFIIGIFQLIAGIFPGTSRSGSTIIGSLIMGVSRTAAAEFTFFLGIPTMFGASLLKLVKHGLSFSAPELAILLIASVVSFAVSMFVIKFLMGYIKKHDFKVFGWYRIVLGILVIICSLFIFK